MKNLMRFGLAGLALAALAVGLLVQHQEQAQAAGRKFNAKMGKSIDAIGMAIAGGKKDVAAKAALKIAKAEEEVFETMMLFKMRGKRGYGVGKDKGKIFPDGIERLLQKMGRDAPAKAFITKNKDALIKMAHRTAAIAEVSDVLAPIKKKNREFTRRKPQAKWVKFSKDMKSASLELVKAVNSGSPAAVKTAAAKVDATCSSCHSIFRD